MKNIIKNIFAVALLATALVSCAGLDELPDNRTLMDSPDKIIKLMTSAYPRSSHAVLCEYSGDNLLDDNVVVPNCHAAAYSEWIDEAYQWKDIKNYSPNSDDTPYTVWEEYYHGISVCNHAIAAMEQISINPAKDPTLAGTWAEAHVLRAYLHFILVNMFAESYKNETLSMSDRGIPYVTKVEDVVSVDYSSSNTLHNVKETYDLIEKDLKVGVSLNSNNQVICNISDNIYPAAVRAFHMNRNSAYAFAARFYLFKRDYEKCKIFADMALGNNPASMLRKWSQFNTNTVYTKRDAYWDENAPCNFMIQSTYSLQWRYHITTTRHAINDGKKITTADGTTYEIPSTLQIALYGKGPNWTQRLPCYDGMVYINGAGQEFGCYHMHLIEYFEYTDKIAGIGYVHMLYQPFSAEETLLCRAEAELYLGDKAAALEDLNFWTASKSSAEMQVGALSMNQITSFYNRANKSNIYVSELAPAEMGFQKVLTDPEDQAMLDCILHFRRIETLHNGDRWFDIKRYGIKVRHFWRGPKEDDIHVDSLTWNDPRRVLQLPSSVIDAGYESNRGTFTPGGGRAGGYAISKPWTGGNPIPFKK